MSNLDPKSAQSIARTAITDELGNSVMFPFDAVTTVGINSQKVFDDVCFSWSKRFTLPGSGTNNGTSWIIINGANIPAEKTFVILPVFFAATGAGPIFVDLHINPIYTNAVNWEGLNRLGTSLTETSVVVEYVQDNTKVSSQGTKLPPEFMIASNGISAVASFGGQTKEDLILVGRKDVKYAFKLMNQENVAAKCVFALSIFEAVRRGQ